jgi:lysophospholipase L1-like esterase
MKSHLVLLAFVTLAAGVASAAEPALPRTHARLTGGEPVKIVCLGDSVTGVYYHTGSRRAYTDMIPFAVRAVFPEARLEMINAGISGNTTVNGLERLDRDVLAHRPHLVTVMFGLNDMVRISPEDFRRNLARIIRRCRDAGAEVLLCTPNGIIDTPGRPVAKLAACCEAIKEVAKEEKAPVCDCHAAYAALKDRDARAWRLLLSDEIHPNMDGHKLNAEEIGHALTGKRVSLKDVGPPQPALPRTLARLQAGEPVRILAMTPYDRLIEAAFKEVNPSAKVEVMPWPVADRTLAQIEQSAKAVRGKKIDLVLVAVPAAATAGQPAEQAIRSYSWILNGSLSFGKQEWDVVAITPSAAKADLTAEEKQQDEFARHMVRAQDLTAIVRQTGDTAPVERLLVEWLRGQLAGPGKK